MFMASPLLPQLEPVLTNGGDKPTSTLSYNKYDFNEILKVQWLIYGFRQRFDGFRNSISCASGIEVRGSVQCQSHKGSLNKASHTKRETLGM